MTEHSTELFALCEELRRRGFKVIAPIRSSGVVKLVELSPRDRPEFNYVRTINSPRDFLLPNHERLFSYKSIATVTSYGLKIRFPTIEEPCPTTITPECTLPKEKLAFLGIHPCMVNAIRYLDKVMLTEPADPYYKSRRENLFIAALECLEGDEYCFCKPLGSYKIPAGYSDLVLRRNENGFSVRCGTERGKEVLRSIGLKEDVDIHEITPRMIKDYRLNSIKEDDIDAMDVKEYLERCSMCSSCTVVCPTCYCSDIEDRFNLINPSSVERVRVRSSCQRRSYSTIAGGILFLKNKEARFKWRLKHKFPFSERSYQTLGCVGCGNCIAFCPSRIDLRELLKVKEHG